MNSDFKDLLRALSDENVEYLIVGGYAVGKHSEPRYTKDLDIWVKTSPENAQRVYSALSNFGAPLEGIPPSVFEDPELIYQIGVEPNRIDVLMDVDGSNFDDCWERRVESSFGTVKAVFISIDDLIKTKLLLARPQDLIDAENLRKKIELEPQIKNSID